MFNCSHAEMKRFVDKYIREVNPKTGRLIKINDKCIHPNITSELIISHGYKEQFENYLEEIKLDKSKRIVKESTRNNTNNSNKKLNSFSFNCTLEELRSYFNKRLRLINDIGQVEKFSGVNKASYETLVSNLIDFGAVEDFENFTGRKVTSDNLQRFASYPLIANSRYAYVNFMM